jgi:hypothetical protein
VTGPAQIRPRALRARFDGLLGAVGTTVLAWLSRLGALSVGVRVYPYVKEELDIRAEAHRGRRELLRYLHDAVELNKSKF